MVTQKIIYRWLSGGITQISYILLMWDWLCLEIMLNSEPSLTFANFFYLNGKEMALYSVPSLVVARYTEICLKYLVRFLIGFRSIYCLNGTIPKFLELLKELSNKLVTRRATKLTKSRRYTLPIYLYQSFIPETAEWTLRIFKQTAISTTASFQTTVGELGNVHYQSKKTADVTRMSKHPVYAPKPRTGGMKIWRGLKIVKLITAGAVHDGGRPG